jgi:hypothetical protein
VRSRTEPRRRSRISSRAIGSLQFIVFPHPSSCRYCLRRGGMSTTAKLRISTQDMPQHSSTMRRLHWSHLYKADMGAYMQPFPGGDRSRTWTQKRRQSRIRFNDRVGYSSYYSHTQFVVRLRREHVGTIRLSSRETTLSGLLHSLLPCD